MSIEEIDRRLIKDLWNYTHNKKILFTTYGIVTHPKGKEELCNYIESGENITIGSIQAKAVMLYIKYEKGKEDNGKR